MMIRVAKIITIFLALAAVTITLLQLFPRSGHLGPKSDVIERLINTGIPAVIATVVMLIFRVARGKVNLKLPVYGFKERLEFSATQTQSILWCLVYIVVKIF